MEIKGKLGIFVKVNKTAEGKEFLTFSTRIESNNGVFKEYIPVLFTKGCTNRTELQPGYVYNIKVNDGNLTLIAKEDKAEKAIYTEGATFLNVLAPCPRGWGYPTDMLMQINKLAVETCYWPLYEVIDGRYVINYKPANKLPIEEFLKPQKRFKHMFKPGNEWMIEEFQKEVDKRWEALLKLEETTNR